MSNNGALGLVFCISPQIKRFLAHTVARLTMCCSASAPHAATAVEQLGELATSVLQGAGWPIGLVVRMPGG